MKVKIKYLEDEMLEILINDISVFYGNEWDFSLEELPRILKLLNNEVEVIHK